MVNAKKKWFKILLPSAVASRKRESFLSAIGHSHVDDDDDDVESESRQRLENGSSSFSFGEKTKFRQKLFHYY